MNSLRPSPTWPTTVRRPWILRQKNHTPVRFLNWLLVEIQCRVFRNSYVLGMPFQATVDPGNICNLGCPLCPTGRGDRSRPKGQMGISAFKQIIDELGPYLYHVDLFNWGEPLLNKDLCAMIAYAKGYAIEVFVSTNLNILSEESAEGLVKSNLDKLLISMDGFSQETYGQYLRRGNLDRVLSNIEMLVEKRKELNASRPELQIRFLVFSHNEHEISTADTMAKRLGVDRLELVPIRLDMGMEILERKENRVRKHQKWLPNDATLNRYRNPATTIRRGTCSKLWRQTTINWNGSVSPCCSVFAQAYDFGNILEGGFRKIWNNQKYTSSRRIVGRNETTEVNTICAICKENGFLDF